MTTKHTIEGEMDKEEHKFTISSASTEKILYKEGSYAIQGAIFVVYRVMGCGFLEAVYQECLETIMSS
jgi:hypothetical protein